MYCIPKLRQVSHANHCHIWWTEAFEESLEPVFQAQSLLMTIERKGSRTVHQRWRWDFVQKWGINDDNFDVDDDFSHDKSIKSGVFSPESLPIWRFCLRKSRLHRMKSQKQCGIGKLVPKTDSISICELYIYMYKVYIVIIYVMYPAQACCNAFCTRPPLCWLLSVSRCYSLDSSEVNHGIDGWF